MNDNIDQALYLVESLIKGDYCVSIESNDKLSLKLNELAKTLKTQSEKEMSQVVSLSVQTNETAILSAHMLYEMKRVDEQAQTIAAAGEEMTATVAEIGKYGKNISEQATQAREAAISGEQASEDTKTQMSEITRSVRETSDRVSTLDDLSQSISSILEAIKKIASQTNLLALNATIEAARAGDAGKGFAVVASEVKNLSRQTADATEQIANIIEQLQNEMGLILESMGKSSDAVNQGEQSIENLAKKISLIRQRIDEVSTNTHSISDTLSEQALASNEVAEGISKIAGSSSNSVSGIEKIVDAMNAVEKMISAQITLLSELNIPAKVVKLAQSDHVIWKKRLADMIAGREGLNPDELADHHSCRLGKWYDALDDNRYTQHPDFIKLIEPHKKVHEHGIQAARYYNSGNTKQALKEIQLVEAASMDVLAILSKLESIETS